MTWGGTQDPSGFDCHLLSSFPSVAFPPLPTLRYSSGKAKLLVIHWMYHMLSSLSPFPMLFPSPGLEPKSTSAYEPIGQGLSWGVKSLGKLSWTLSISSSLFSYNALCIILVLPCVSLK